MCAGAIVNARIPNVYFGAYDKKYGACGSVINIFNMKENFKVTYEGGFKGKESLELFDKFFNFGFITVILFICISPCT